MVSDMVDDFLGGKVESQVGVVHNALHASYEYIFIYIFTHIHTYVVLYTYLHSFDDILQYLFVCIVCC